MCKCFLQVSSINRAMFIALSFHYGAVTINCEENNGMAVGGT
jgi:hypothetical protein